MAGAAQGLIWNSIPTNPGQAADLVLGQPNFTARPVLGITSQVTMNSPAAVFFDGTRLYVADSGAARVLIWNNLPTANQVPADVVLGQTEFGNLQKLRPATKWSMFFPAGLYVHNGRLFVSDRDNNRVMVWNTIPTTNGQPADIILGQPNESTSIPNNDGDVARPVLSGQSVNTPLGLTVTPDLLFIADPGNNRVLALPNPPI